MSKNELTKTPTIPAEIRDLLGDPPLLETEDFEQYEGILIKFAQCVRPRDVFEWFWIKDAADARYEIQRCRNLKSRLIQVAKEVKLEQTINQIASQYQSAARNLRMVDTLARPTEPGGWPLPATEAAKKKFEKEMEEYKKNRPEKERQLKAELDRLEAAAQEEQELVRARADADEGAGAFEGWIESYEKADRLQATAEKRFNAALEQLDLHRQGLGLRLRQASDEIVDGEFDEVQASFGPARASPALPADAAAAPAPLNEVEATELAGARRPESTAAAPPDVPANDAIIAPAPTGVSPAAQDGEQLVPAAEVKMAMGEGEAPPATSEPTDSNPVSAASG